MDKDSSDEFTNEVKESGDYSIPLRRGNVLI